MANIAKEKPDEFYQVACVHCGETVFKFSRFTILQANTLMFKCPKCGKATIISFDSYSNRLEIEEGVSNVEK